MLIAKQNLQTGKVYGYTIIRKTSKTPKILSKWYHLTKNPSWVQTTKEPHIPEEELERDLLSYDESSSEKQDTLITLCRKYHLQHRFVPAEGYKFVGGIGYVKKNHSLESAVTTSIFMGVGLTIAFLFLNNITGFAISSEITKAKTNLGLAILSILIILAFLIKPKLTKRNRKSAK